MCESGGGGFEGCLGFLGMDGLEGVSEGGGVLWMVFGGRSRRSAEKDDFISTFEIY